LWLADTGTGVERRKSTRFRLHCEVTCTWRDDYGVVNTIRGAAQNISAGGLFISSPGRPWVGMFATVDIQLPSRVPLGQQLQLHGTARVVRVIQDGDRSGFAVAGSSGWAIARSRGRAEATAV
jgi:hypothetical protein